MTKNFNIIGGQPYIEGILHYLIQRTFLVISDVLIPQATWWLSNVTLTLYVPPINIYRIGQHITFKHQKNPQNLVQSSNHHPSSNNATRTTSLQPFHGKHFNQ